MPFMIGKAPIRRTIKYLEAGRLMLNDSIKILSVNYNTYGEHHQGARFFLPYFNYFLVSLISDPISETLSFGRSHSYNTRTLQSSVSPLKI